MKMVRFFFLFALSLDQYRWALFREQIEHNDYNCKFWQMRERRFDAPAKYHISENVYV